MRVIHILLITMLTLQGCTALLVGAAGTAVVAGSMQEQSIGSTIDDTILHAKIDLALQNKKFYNIQIKVVEGTVLLVGVAAEPDVITETVQLVESVNGVKKVINELAVQPEEKSAIASALIATQVKLKIFASYPIKFINYKVLTVDNVVYLIGIAQNDKELNNIIQIANTIKGVKKVVSHVRLKKGNSEKKL